MSDSMAPLSNARAKEGGAGVRGPAPAIPNLEATGSVEHACPSVAEHSDVASGELRIVVVGGVAAGMSAATRARRMNETARITVLERGGFISFANCGLPYFLSGKIRDQAALFLTTPEQVGARFRIDARVHHEVTHIDRINKVVHGMAYETDSTFQFAYDKLILAPGAAPIQHGATSVAASNSFVLRNIEDTQRLDAFLTNERPKSVVVVGAGFIGLEMVEALHGRGLRVTVIEKGPHLLPALDPEMAGWVEQELARNGVDVRVRTGIMGLRLDAGRVVAVETDVGEALHTDMVLLSMGVRPVIELAQRAGLSIGDSGGIHVDKALRTSDPDIYAVGDAAEVISGVSHLAARIPLAGAANRHGRSAGEHAATGRGSAASSVYGTAIVRVFDLDVGVTGLGLHSAKQLGYDAEAVIVHPNDHAGYYPGAEPIHLELVFDRSTGRILGAQAVGKAGIDKRIDVVATLLHFGGKVDDLAALDLAYAPQFSGAKDGLHFAAFVAQNHLRGLSPTTSEIPAGAQVVDVREDAEHALGSLPGSLHIPLGQLRARLSELDPQRPTVVYCQVGVRGHAATRILLQHGFKYAKNLSGGFAQVALRRL